jgi:hypothetical protein
MVVWLAGWLAGMAGWAGLGLGLGLGLAVWRVWLAGWAGLGLGLAPGWAGLGLGLAPGWDLAEGSKIEKTAVFSKYAVLGGLAGVPQGRARSGPGTCQEG